MKKYTYDAGFDDNLPYEEEMNTDRVFENDEYSGGAVSEDYDSYGFYPDTSF